ncbi:MAG: Spx/MgsR family RNA polymerase-binding regulatory protein, partial [Polyangiaceae bacterium]
MLTIYHYPNCSTCKKAIAFLKERGTPFKAIDLVATPPAAAILSDLHQRSGLTLNKLFNTSGASYHAGKFGDKLPTMSEAQAVAALAADGKLIKRPIIDTGKEVIV